MTFYKKKLCEIVPKLSGCQCICLLQFPRYSLFPELRRPQSPISASRRLRKLTGLNEFNWLINCFTFGTFFHCIGHCLGVWVNAREIWILDVAAIFTHRISTFAWCEQAANSKPENLIITRYWKLLVQASYPWAQPPEVIPPFSEHSATV